MNRFSYLAAITAVNAAPTLLASNQLLLETGIGLTKNIRTFSYRNVASEWKTIPAGDSQAVFETKILGTAAGETGIMNDFKLVLDEWFIVEINEALADIKFIIDGTATDKTTVAAAAFTTNLASDATTLIDAVAQRVDGTNLFGATNTGFIKNYLYPAYLLQCKGAGDGNTSGFALEGTVSSTKYYQSFKCTNKTNSPAGRKDTDANLLNHATLEELNADASNRLVASTTKDLSTDTDGKLNKVTTENPTTSVGGNWLAAENVDNFGKKLAGEFFTVGANTNGIKTTGGSPDTIKAAIMTVIPTAECLSSGSTLNFLTPHAKNENDVVKSATVYSGRAYMVPTGATPGQKYYSCIKVGQADPNTATSGKNVYTTVEVDVTRPTFWQYSATTTNGATAGLFASPGTTNAGLPSAGNEWGLPAITGLTSTGVTAWVTAKGTANVGGASPVQMAGDVTTKDSVTVAHWTGASTAGIKREAVSARAGEYLIYKFSATTAAQKLIANFWTGQAGMGRSSLPAETATFKHLELFSFAQPGAQNTPTATSTESKPVVVLRVPENAQEGDGTVKYYAGFQVSDDADGTVGFYTTSLTVTVTARRFGNVASWKQSLVQPLFTDPTKINALTAGTTPRTSAPTAAEMVTDTTAAASGATAPVQQWGTSSMVTGAIPGQVVGFSLPNQVRIDEVLTTTAADTPLLDERGSFQGSVAATTSPGGVISFMVPADADGTKTKYYASLKISNAGTTQYLAVSVELKAGAKATGTNAIYSDGLNTLNTGTAGDASVTVSEVTVKAGGIATPPADWWTKTEYILTPNLKLMDSEKAYIAFDANVGLTDTTATKITATAQQLTALRVANIPADGFKTNTGKVPAAANTVTEKATWPVVEVQMPSTQVTDFDYTDKYVYRTYEMLLGGNAADGVGAKYYGAIRAKVLSPEIWETKANFDDNIPLSAKGYTAFKVDTATTATAWTIGAAAGAAATAPAAASGANPATAWADNAVSTNNQIKRNVQNGNSFVIAIDHNLGTVTWEPTAIPLGKDLERREQLTCAAFAAVGTASPGVECVPSWSFRMPATANTGDKYYAAFKAVVGAESNGLAAGTYWVSIEGTVTAPIRHYATWADIQARDAVMWSFTNVGTDTAKIAALNAIFGAGTSTSMDSSVTASADQGFNKQWKLKKVADDVKAGWQDGASNLFAANVAAGAEACFDFREFTAGVSLVTAEVATNGVAYTATTGSEPAIAAQVTSNQLHNTDAGVNAWCFTAPASGFGYVIVKTGDWYLPIKINTEGRERAFPTVATFTADAGDRWSGSVHRVYNDLPREWADTPAAVAPATTPKINTNFLIDEVAVKKSSDGTDAAAAVDVGAFAVVIGGDAYEKCTEYAEASMEDTEKEPKALTRPTKWLTSFGSVHSATDFSRVGTKTWAFSWQVPSDATAGDLYYIGLRCEARANSGDFSAMWKVSITDAPTFTATSADLKVAAGNQKKTFTKFNEPTEGLWVGGETTVPGIPDPRWDTITASFEVVAGSGFSVEINKLAVTAEVVAEADLIDEYNKPLNLEARSLILFGEVAKLTPSTGTAAAPPIVAAKWSALAAATATEFPAYSWQVPSDAEVGEVHYAAVRAVDGGNKYVALFEVTVKAAPAPAPEEPEEEASGVMGAVITTALVTAAIAAALFFFVL